MPVGGRGSDVDSDDEDFFKKEAKTDKQGQEAGPSYLLHGKLTLTIVEADVPGGTHKINPFVQLKCGGESFKTEVDTKGDKKPKWNHSLIINFDNAQKDEVVLHLVVTDRGTLSKNLGKMDIPVDSLFPQKSDGKDLKDPTEFSLIVPKNPKKQAGKIWLKAEWDGRGMPWQSDESVGSDGKEAKKAIMMHGKLTLTVHRAENLREVQLIGKQDPYVEIKFGEYSYKTRVHEKAGAFPVWNQDFLFNVDNPQNEQISFLVYDKEPLIDNKICRIDMTIGRLLLKKDREQLLQLLFWENFHKIAGDLYVTAIFTGKGAPITEEDKKKEEAKKKEAEAAELQRIEMEKLVLKVTKNTEDQANIFIAGLHAKHEQEKLQAQEELKKQQEEINKQKEELKRVQDELLKQQEEKDRLKREAEAKAQAILEEQAAKNALVKQQAQDELKKLQDEIKQMQEMQAKIALDNDLLRRQTEAREAELKTHKEEVFKEQKQREEIEIQLKEYKVASKRKEQPTEVTDPLHPHPLKLEKSVYKKGEYICDKCEKRFSGHVYHCAECRWDLHPGCALGYIAWQQAQS